MVAILMMVDTKNIPFDINPVTKSKAWQDAAPEIRQKFVANATTFSTMINYYADKYRAKKTLKGEFFACVLWDFYWDMLETPCNYLDQDLAQWYADPENKQTSLEVYSNVLLDQAIHAKRWIKILKTTYKYKKAVIKEMATDEDTGKINLDLVNDFSADYRDIFY